VSNTNSGEWSKERSYLVAAGTWSEVLVCQVQLLDTERTDFFLLIIVDELVL